MEDIEMPDQDGQTFNPFARRVYKIKCNVRNEELAERAAQRKERCNLKSTHGKTADIYDQFYRDHKLLLKLFVILGVMPVVRSAPGKVTFSWRSPQTIYAVAFYVVTSFLVLRVGYERIRILQTTKAFDEYIYAIIFVIFLVPHFWIPYVGWGVANRVAYYKTMWGPFQVRFYRITGTCLTFSKLNFLIIVLFIGCVVWAVALLTILHSMLEGFLLWHTSAYYHIITMINMFAAMFYINTKAIKSASRSLAKCLRKDLDEEATPSMIHQYRLLWLNLSDILQTLGNVYSRTYSSYCLLMAVNITVGSYGFLSEMVSNGVSFKVLGLVVLTFYCVLLLFSVCDSADSATTVLVRDVSDILLSIDMLTVDAQVRKEVDYFISAIEISPPVVSMQGYGIVNRQLLTGTIATVAIYLILLLQFKLQIAGGKSKHKTTI